MGSYPLELFVGGREYPQAMPRVYSLAEINRIT